MIGKVRIHANTQEINQAKERASDLGIPVDIPEPIIVCLEFGFNIEDVNIYHLDTVGGIIIQIDGDFFELEYNKELHKKLKDKFSA